MVDTRSLWRVTHPDLKFPGPVDTLERVREWIRLRAEHPDHELDASLYGIEKVPTCGCCGTDQGLTAVYDGRIDAAARHYRCEKHVERIPCAIEGCRRTYKLELGDSYSSRVVCGKHWRLAPKHMRDAVARVRRIGVKANWPRPIINRFCRLWERTVRAAQSAAAGDIDVAEINRVMGWDQ
ncbi:hypothetical protein [Sphingopyxis sp. 113P3]|uniref:hypothetical protein n=1 Tax=Sphingopyxis sp. (strain 113P3) TaxID=292913 RepID=UPI0006AD2247|nr:hypothetical protein [Sphingopyxis sp. 113P3]ALC13794.1 hypothetical protein LH20_17690 [Sphingopyxis sp. 113P3]